MLTTAAGITGCNTPDTGSSSSSTADDQKRTTASAEPEKTPITFTSDPSGATLSIGVRSYGPTPTTVELPVGVESKYTLTPEEPYEDFKLYKPFTGTVTPSAGGAEISVWIDRTTADEQEQQQAAAAAERERVAQERCRQQAANAKLVLENWSWHKSYGHAIAEGLITNISGAPMDNIQAVVTFYTADGSFISSDTALIDYRPLLAGQSSPLTVYATLNPAMTSARLEFKEFFGGTIRSIERSAMDC